MTDFETGLIDHLDSLDRPTAVQKRLRKILERPASNRKRRRVLAQAEGAFRGQLGVDGQFGAIDWSSIDWDKLFAAIVKLIEMIMSLFA